MDLATDDHEEEVLFEPTAELAAVTCATYGCDPKLVLADNGFTHETICGRCGNSL